MPRGRETRPGVGRGCSLLMDEADELGTRDRESARPSLGPWGRSRSSRLAGSGQRYLSALTLTYVFEVNKAIGVAPTAAQTPAAPRHEIGGAPRASARGSQEREPHDRNAPPSPSLGVPRLRRPRAGARCERRGGRAAVGQGARPILSRLVGHAPARRWRPAPSRSRAQRRGVQPATGAHTGCPEAAEPRARAPREQSAAPVAQCRAGR
jgi:hypothetical protein